VPRLFSCRFCFANEAGDINASAAKVLSLVEGNKADLH